MAAPGYPVIRTDAAGDLILTNESYLVRIGFHLIHRTRGVLWRRAVQRVLIKNNGHAFLLTVDILAIAGLRRPLNAVTQCLPHWGDNTAWGFRADAAERRSGKYPLRRSFRFGGLRPVLALLFLRGVGNEYLHRGGGKIH